MTIETKIAKRAKAHTVYKLADGKRVPGVTTILEIIAKPALISWANGMGRQGLDSEAYRNEAAKIGTLAHEMIQEDLGGHQWNRNAYSADQIDLAENAILSYYEWQRINACDMKTEHIELPLVSEVHRYGGTIDWYGEINGEKWLVDIKTSKKIYSNHQFQVAAYWQLLQEHDYRVDGVRLLRVGRTEDEGFEDYILDVPTLSSAWNVFEAALKLYRLKQKFEKEAA
jgi:hypothetical protein